MKQKRMNKKKIFKKLVVEKRPSNTFIQFFRHLFSGSISTLVDMLVFYLFNSLFFFHYLIAQTTGFLAGLIVCYTINAIWIFKFGKNVKKQFIYFFLVAFSGLFLSYLLLFVIIGIFEITQFQNMIAKMITVLIIQFWNFLMRKKFVFNN